MATSAFTEEIGVFFWGRRFQLLPDQQPQAVLARDYIATFKVLPLYDIESSGCAPTLAARGLDERRFGAGCRMPGAGCPARTPHTM
jgi:tRNA 2-thiouridine synthesizing protein C